MTTPYGVTSSGIRDQLRNEVLPKYEGLSDNAFESFVQVFGYILNTILKVIVGRARDGQKFLRALAKACGENPFEITTPLGFLFKSAYQKSKTHRLSTVIGGKRKRIQFKIFKRNKIATGKQASGMSPHVIHGLDSTHLMMVTEAVNLDKSMPNNIMLIHDSFGVGAGHVDSLISHLKQTFFDLYSQGNILEDYRNQLEDAGFEKLPKLPPTGSCDLSKILDSEYMFS